MDAVFLLVTMIATNVFMIHLDTKLHMPLCSGSLFITTKLSAKHIFCTAAMLFYIPQNITLMKDAYFSKTIQNFGILH